MLLRNGAFAKSLLTQGTRASRHNTAHSISDIVRVTASRRERRKSGQHDSTVRLQCSAESQERNPECIVDMRP